MSHFYSALPSNLLLPTTGKAGGIFVTDVTGDGSGDGSVVYPLGDPIPGTNLGAFGGASYGSNINSTIQLYNARLGATPAGAALIRANIINVGQLSALKGVEQALNAGAHGTAGTEPAAQHRHHRWDGITGCASALWSRPSVSIFNLFNFANFDGANNPLSPILNTVG